VLGIGGRVALDRGYWAKVGDDDHDLLGVFQTQQFEVECLAAGVRYRVADEDATVSASSA